jgi:cell division control protein 6
MLAPLLKGSKPSNILLYGKTGTGKTLIVKYVMNKLIEKSKFTNINIKFIYVNARLVGTEYRILLEFANSLGLRLPFTGLSISEAFSRILTHLSEQHVKSVFIFDEIDFYVKNYGDNLLYEFTRSHDHLPFDTFISVIGISNDLKFKDFLDPRVLSSLSEEEIVFPPYTVEELKIILEERAKLAFNEGVITPSAINFCAALAGSEHGDARRAVDLLRVAGELAERYNAPQITDEHVRMAAKSIERDRIYEAVRSLPLHAKLVLLSVAYFNEPVNTGKLYSKYLELCKKVGLPELTQRRVSGLLSELDLLGLISAPVISKGRFGRSKLVKLAIPITTIKNALYEEDVLRTIL